MTTNNLHSTCVDDLRLAEKYQAGALGRTLEFDNRTLPDILKIQQGLGDKAMIQTADRSLSYAQAPIVAATYAGKLRSLGVKPGDRVITFMSSRIEQLELWLGISWLGAIMTPVNTAFRGEQLSHAINTADPTLIITEASLQEHLQHVPDAVSLAQGVFVVGEDGELATKPIGSLTAQRFVNDAEPVSAYAVKPSDIAAILYTSGTTGPSKGVLCPHAQFYWWGVLTGESLGINEQDVLFTVLPFFHTNALNSLWQSMLYGATYSFSPRFSASGFWQEAKDNNATITYLLGAMAQILLKRPESEHDTTHTIRAALCPATPLEMVNDFNQRFGIKLIEGYGSTETNLVFSNVIGGHAPASMGRVVDGFDVRIVDENDCDVEVGLPGELIIRNTEPFSMASGYFGNPKATAKSWRNLWFHTGDRVVCDAETGIYFFLDRLVDAIRRRGENISSWEVENALMAHPDVEEAAVFGVPSDLGSEEDVMTHVVMREGRDVEVENIIRFLEPRLAYFAIPRYWRFVDDLPKTENGKVKKHVLRDVGITAEAWDLEKADFRLNRGAA